MCICVSVNSLLHLYSRNQYKSNLIPGNQFLHFEFYRGFTQEFVGSRKTNNFYILNKIFIIIEYNFRSIYN